MLKSDFAKVIDFFEYVRAYVLISSYMNLLETLLNTR